MLRRILITSSILSAAACFSFASGCSSSSSGNPGTGSSSGGTSEAGEDSSGSSSGGVGDDSGSSSGSSGGSSGSGSGSGGDASNLVCPPETPDTGAFMPFTYPAPTKYSGACNAAARQGFITACVATGATTATCDAWQMANFPGADGGGGTACGLCMITQNDNGPLWISPDGLFFGPNYGACIQVTDSSANGQKCGSDFNNLNGCLDTYCDYCQVSMQTSANITACQNAADTSQCTAAQTALNTDCPSDLGDGGVGLSCFPGGNGATGQQTDLEYIINLLCGNADGG